MRMITLITNDEEAEAIFDALDDAVDSAIDNKRDLPVDSDEMMECVAYIDMLRSLQFRIRGALGKDTSKLYD